MLRWLQRRSTRLCRGATPALQNAQLEADIDFKGSLEVGEMLVDPLTVRKMEGFS